MSDRYRAWLLRTGELVFEARSGMWQRDCAGYVQPYPHHYRGTEMQPYLLPDGDELTQHVTGEAFDGGRIAAGIRQYCNDLNTELAYHEPTRDTSLLQRFHDDADSIARYILEG